MDLRERQSILEAAISYAPIGTRDAAGAALEDLLQASRASIIQETPTLLGLQAEVNELKGFAEEAIDTLTRIRQGGPRLAGGTFEGEARDFMARFAKTILKYQKRDHHATKTRAAS